MSESLLIRKESFGVTRSDFDGWSRLVKPVPKTGRIKFADIGNLTIREHEGSRDVDLSSDIAQQMIGKQGVKPIDPKDFRGAVWGMGTKLNDDFDLGPPEPDTWNYGFLQNFEGSTSRVTYDEEKDALCLVADLRDGDYQENWGKHTNTVAMYYVGRFASGTRLKFEMEMENRNQNKYGPEIKALIRGWESGWFGGEYYEYVEWAKSNRGDGFGKFSTDFRVMDTYPDIWLSCEVKSNDPRFNNYEKAIGYFRRWKISLA